MGRGNGGPGRKIVMAARQQGENLTSGCAKRRTGSAQNTVARNFDHTVELQEKAFRLRRFRGCGSDEEDPAAQPFLDELA